MINDGMPKKIVVYLLIYCHGLVGCFSSGQNNVLRTGPRYSSSYEQDVAQQSTPSIPRLDVIIPVFDPGLSGQAEDYEEEGIWPELRRAEANRFAYKLRNAMDKTSAFNAIRVTPDKTATGDLYILGQIEESNGEDVAFKLTVIDISGRQWFSRSFSHSVKESFYKNYRKQGSDPYEPVFEEAANEIVEALRDQDRAGLDDLKYISKLRFGASFNEDAFLPYMNTEGNYYKLVGVPSDNDPMLMRINAIRLKEQMFIDNLQQNYKSFSANMEQSYLKWQEASFTERQLHKAAEMKGILKTIGGIALITLSVATAVSSGNRSDSNSNMGAVALMGGLAGAWMLSSSFKSREEAEFHKQTIDELGGSVNIEMAPQVLNLEKQTVELTGNVQQQFSQWRAFLKRIYSEELTPTTEL